MSWRSLGLGYWFGGEVPRGLQRVVEAQYRTPREICVLRKVGASVCATAFLTAQSGDHDHQASDRGVARSTLRDRKRIERAGGRAQSLAVTQHAGVLRQDRTDQSWIASVGVSIRQQFGPARPDRGCRSNISGDPVAAYRRFQQRITGEPIGAMQAGAGDFATGPESLDGSPSASVDGYAAHVVVRGRTNRDGLRDRINSCFTAQCRDGRETPRKVQSS